MANGNQVTSEGRGSGILKFLNQKNEEFSAKLTDVLYVPAIGGNLLSVRKLNEKSLSVDFKKNFCEIKQGHRQIAVADLKSNLFKLRQTATKAYSAVEHKDDCVHYWHRVCGHRDPQAVVDMCSKGLVEGVKLSVCGLKHSCEICLESKYTRLPFPKKSLSKSVAPLDLIHTDVCGPMPTVSPSGKRYIVTFIDDFTRYTVIYLLKHKSEVFSKMQEYVAMVKTMFHRKPKMIRSDRGGEYTGNEVVKFLKNEGIQIQYTAAYSPEQNGVAERKNRTLIEMARCMLLDASLQNTFWAEAVTAANYMQNRLPTRASLVTPYEGWTGCKPNINHFRIFGLKCYVHIPSEKRRKMDSTAKQAIFVGYDEQSKAYRCYDLSSRRVVVSRDVRFADCVGMKTTETPFIAEHFEEPNPEKASVPVEFDFGFKSTYEVIESQDTEQETEQQLCETEHQECDDNEIMVQENILDHQEETVTLRRSERSNKGVPPEKLIQIMNVTEEEKVEPKNLKDVMSSKNKEEWLSAMKEEIYSLKKNGTWELCELPKGKNVVGSKWVFKMKKGPDEKITRYKARLVAQGFSQKYGTDYDQVFAPVVKQTTLRILLSIAGKNNMTVQHLDAKTAFLNGELHEIIFMKQPPGFEEEGREHLVCLLKKSLYGLKQAARAWNDAIHSVLMSTKFNQSRADPCFYFKREKEHWCYILIYVDDLIVTSKNLNMIEFVQTTLSSKFEMKNLGNVKNYLGLEVEKDEKGNYNICQQNYIEQIVKDFGLADSKLSNVPIDPNYGKQVDKSEILIDNSKYQKLIGCLLYISVNTRPDISASVSIMAQKVNRHKRTGTSLNKLNSLLYRTHARKLHGFVAY